MISLNLSDLEVYQDLDILREIDILKSEIDALRPLDTLTESRIMQKFRLDWNYNSNAIEGNSLDYGETVAFLMHGLTAKGKPLKDHLDIKGHNETIDYLIDLIKHKEQISEKDIREIHKMLLVEPYSNPSKSDDGVVLQRQISIGKYKTMPNHVQTATGETHYYASPEDTPYLMQQLVDWFRESVENNQLHPVIIAAIFHHRLTSIHPFDDGNGRMSRLLMNLVLMQYGFPPIVIKKINRNEYYQTLSQADVGDDQAFIQYIGKNLVYSLKLYLRGATGESIEEPTDLQRKIELFKRELEGNEKRVQIRKSDEVIENLFQNEISDFLSNLDGTLRAFDDLFFEHDKSYLYSGDRYDQWKSKPITNYSELWDLSKKKAIANEPTIINFRFTGFKLDKNSFSINVLIVLTFNEFSYIINNVIVGSGIIENSTPSDFSQILSAGQVFEKYYHQKLSTIETNDLINIIGNDIFSSIKSRKENNYESLEGQETKLIGQWNELIDSFTLSIQNETLLRNVTFDFDDFSLIVKLAEPAYNELSPEELNELHVRFYNKVAHAFRLSDYPIILVFSEPEAQ